MFHNIFAVNLHHQFQETLKSHFNDSFKTLLHKMYKRLSRQICLIANPIQSFTKYLFLNFSLRHLKRNVQSDYDSVLYPVLHDLKYSEDIFVGATFSKNPTSYKTLHHLELLQRLALSEVKYDIILNFAILLETLSYFTLLLLLLHYVKLILYLFLLKHLTFL